MRHGRSILKNRDSMSVKVNSRKGGGVKSDTRRDPGSLQGEDRA